MFQLTLWRHNKTTAMYKRLPDESGLQNSFDNLHISVATEEKGRLLYANMLSISVFQHIQPETGFYVRFRAATSDLQFWSLCNNVILKSEQYSSFFEWCLKLYFLKTTNSKDIVSCHLTF